MFPYGDTSPLAFPARRAAPSPSGPIPRGGTGADDCHPGATIPRARDQRTRASALLTERSADSAWYAQPGARFDAPPRAWVCLAERVASGRGRRRRMWHSETVRAAVTGSPAVRAAAHHNATAAGGTPALPGSVNSDTLGAINNVAFSHPAHAWPGQLGEASGWPGGERATAARPRWRRSSSARAL